MAKQIRIHPEGAWHRREQGNGHDHTACGQLIEAHMIRDDRFDGNLCPLCFTPHEIEKGELEKIARESYDKIEHGFDEDPTPTDVKPTIPWEKLK